MFITPYFVLLEVCVSQVSIETSIKARDATLRLLKTGMFRIPTKFFDVRKLFRKFLGRKFQNAPLKIFQHSCISEDCSDE